MIGIDYTDPHMSPDEQPCCPLCSQELTREDDTRRCPDCGAVYKITDPAFKEE